MTEKRILIVEDDSSLGLTLVEVLEKEGYTADLAQSLADAYLKLKEDRCELAIVDINLPDGSGISLAETLVAEKKQVPIIILTALDTAERRLQGFELGIEDFIPKPFHLKEFLLRVQKVLSSRHLARTITLGEIIIDLDRRQVSINGRQGVVLSKKDLDLLLLLIRSAPKVVSRLDIAKQVWGTQSEEPPRTIDNSIVRIRQALGDSTSVEIRSVRGEGYQWIEGELKR
ncbi:MAG TPA: response regulator transcription factor [Oligoflexia bacterium]|nr:response regulator transcription factor [Oligoflexia bacterium]HMP26371.1 response regulator transcription factor [Oligoflexia bacterium]